GHRVLDPDDIGQREPAFAQRPGDGRKAVLRLGRDVLGNGHRRIVIPRHARNEAPVSLHDGAAVAERALEWRTGGYQLGGGHVSASNLAASLAKASAR